MPRSCFATNSPTLPRATPAGSEATRVSTRRARGGVSEVESDRALPFLEYQHTFFSAKGINHNSSQE
ncbi:hypothetical protein ANCDUO_08848 [Ancylostoma duodenale]|uniref:Uncharacterized protein n=1 Tax=Ancylostoma duodenale TaxID=51022 RepID=A0A0C2CVI7_9BILA|nr:hypothetical protein ANCDUO_08848 [Ancylostoma duodenale]